MDYLKALTYTDYSMTIRETESNTNANLQECDYKIYGGRFVAGWGIPYVVVAFWESDENHSCDRFIIFQMGKKVLRSGDRISAEKGIYGRLEEFLEYEVIEQAKNKILYEILFKELKNKKRLWDFPFEIKLDSINKMYLINLRGRFPDETNWIKSNTLCDKLRKDIDTLPSSPAIYEPIS